MTSAPKNFIIYGISLKEDRRELLLQGEYSIKSSESCQKFKPKDVDFTIDSVQLIIESNHGNLDNTCVYQLQVHGDLVEEEIIT